MDVAACAEVAELLGYYGYNVVSHGNAEHFNFATTQVVVSAADVERVKPWRII